MANIKSAIKRVKTSEKANAQNTAQKSAMRTTIKKAEAAILNKESNAAELVAAASKSLDKAVSKGLVHKNMAARKKSRLTQKVNSL